MIAFLLAALPFLLAQETTTVDTIGGGSIVQQVYQRYLSGASFSYEETFELARQLAHNNSWDEAIQVYTSLLKNNPEDPDSRLGRGLVYAWQGRFDEASADLRMVTEQVPSYGDAWMALGNVYLWWNRAHQAEPAYSEWIALRPTDSEPYIARAKAHQALRHYVEARDDLRTARTLGGDQAEIDRMLRDLDRIPGARLWESLIVWEMQSFSTQTPTWKTGTLTMKRELSFGSAAPGFTWTRRFDREDLAILLDSYLNLWRRAYANVRFQISPRHRVLPRLDLTAEVYQGLGQNWEMSGSYRLMQFATETVNILGLSTARYAGPWYLRGVLRAVPRNHALDLFGQISARRYLGEVDNFAELNAGVGREVEPGVGEPVFTSTYALAVRGQVFLKPRLGISLTANLISTQDYVRRGVNIGVLTRW